MTHSKKTSPDQTSKNRGIVGGAWGNVGAVLAAENQKPAVLGLAAIQLEQEAEQRQEADSAAAHPKGKYTLTDDATRDRMSHDVGRATTRTSEENRTIRITSLSRATTEADLSNLCGRYGYILRLHLVKDHEAKQSREFAFVTFSHHDEAARALEQLDGHPYDCLILHVDWAKPRKIQAIRQTGYGQAFPQSFRSAWR